MEIYKNAKNVKEYVKKVNINKKIYKVTSSRNVKPNKKRIYKSKKIHRNVYKSLLFLFFVFL